MGKWVPVEDGAITSFIRIENNGQWIKVYPPSNFNNYPEIARLPNDLRLCRLTDDAAEVDMQLIAAAAERLTLSDLEMERDLGYRLLTMVAKLQEANNE